MNRKLKVAGVGLGLSLMALVAFTRESRPAAGDLSRAGSRDLSRAGSRDLSRAGSRDFSKASEEMASAAQAFLKSLSAEQAAKAKFDFKDAERLNWHFIPKERKGLTMKEMNADQRKLAHALLQTGLSAKGFEKATTIMTLEQILAELEGANRRFPRDPLLYHVWVFGTPEARGTWGWRVEGHHLSLSFTLAAGKAIAAAPSFFGTNPALVKDGPRKGLQVLATEENLGRQLAVSLSGDQKAAGIVADKARADIILGPEGVQKQGLKPLEPAGISFARLNPAQQEILKSLLKEYANHHRGELAEQDLGKIEKAGWDKVSFAWEGSLEVGQGHYYRVQGPSFIVEYDNTQNNANHVHAIWHDPAGHLGADILKQHLETDHRK